MARAKQRLNINATPMINKLEVLVRTKLRTGLLGAYLSFFKGVSGLEFDGYRDYTQSDDSKLIDWKASSRARQLLVKEHIETRQLDVFFLIDVSNSMVFGSTEKLKNEYAAELALTLAYIILANGDKVGFGLFNRNVITSRRPGLGTTQYYRMLKELTNPDNHGGGYNLGSALEFVDNYIEKKGTMLVVISDFIGKNTEAFLKLKRVSQKFDTIAVMVRDPRDKQLPKDVEQVFIEDPYSHERMIIESDLIGNFYENYVNKQERDLKNQFTKLNIDFLNLTTDKEFVMPVVNMFSRRRTQWK